MSDKITSLPQPSLPDDGKSIQISVANRIQNSQHKQFPWWPTETQNSYQVVIPIFFWNSIVTITMKEQSVSDQLIVPQQYVTLLEGNESSSSFNVKDTLPTKLLESTAPASHQSPPVANDSINAEEKPRRSISFNPSVRCRLIRSHRDMSESQISRTWLNRADIADIKQDCKQVLYLINADLEVEGMGERGVEHFNTRRVQERKSLRQTMLHEMSCMQDLQTKLCQSMHERCVFSDVMAERFVRLTASSQTLACQRAHSDAASLE